MAVTEVKLNAERTTLVNAQGSTDEGRLNTKEFYSMDESTSHIQPDLSVQLNTYPSDTGFAVQSSSCDYSVPFLSTTGFDVQSNSLGSTDPYVLNTGVDGQFNSLDYLQPYDLTTGVDFQVPTQTLPVLNSQAAFQNYPDDLSQTPESLDLTEKDKSHENLSADISNIDSDITSLKKQICRAVKKDLATDLAYVEKKFERLRRNVKKNIPYIDNIEKERKKSETSQRVTHSHDRSIIQYQIDNIHRHMSPEKAKTNGREIEDASKAACQCASGSEGPIKTLSDLKKEDLFGPTDKNKPTHVDPSTMKLSNPHNPSHMNRWQKLSRNSQKFT
ncbi:hypothetical protein FBEOM_7141 [Fusarium beomiforme]|uniref:Uncharacterized protein n=1 Tax=Fusarium beomiforme TaxID=44412 RepID=A0A9P5DXD9_9HYPO|nr:hypothetical protein FBEOM_7141 [Fusarium beomiforme]